MLAWVMIKKVFFMTAFRAEFTVVLLGILVVILENILRSKGYDGAAIIVTHAGQLTAGFIFLEMFLRVLRFASECLVSII